GERIFALAHGDRVMRDLMVATPEGIVDILGKQRRFRALFAARVIDGELHLTSTRLAVKVGTNHLRVPGPVAPRVKLTERYSAEDGRQHVSVSVRVPILGTVYEYAGSFRYDRKAVAPCG
ncbi:MAG: DUF4166 domain-containing protein, partial [Cryobacterium sp.]|nr:DUF4166 domain-containing protein [Cryobacterium sp.]